MLIRRNAPSGVAVGRPAGPTVGRAEARADGPGDGPGGQGLIPTPDRGMTTPMPLPSPFHERTAPRCRSWRWKDWAGYLAVCRFDTSLDREYAAIRQSCAAIDVSPLFKYDVRGKDAAALLSRMMVRDIGRLGLGRVTYTCWCDDAGKVVDDGTVTRLGDDWFRVTAADPSLAWILRLARGLSVDVSDVTDQVAALALQGPTSRAVLEACCDGDIRGLGFFRSTRGRIDGIEVIVTRTGYTGDLGYEVWCEASRGTRLWDAVFAAGQAHGIEAVGLDALDMSRIEAGFIMLGVDYYSAPKQVLERKKSSPYEIGLGWTVNLDRAPFVGQAALRKEKLEGSPWAMVGLELSWVELERIYDEVGLPPKLPAEASRVPLPVYADGKQVGQVTSSVWSPLLKKFIALASVRSGHAKVGTALRVEHTVEFERRSVAAQVVDTPFYNPERKRNP